MVAVSGLAVLSRAAPRPPPELPRTRGAIYSDPPSLQFLATLGASANFSEMRTYIMVTENGTRIEACMQWKSAVVVALV